MKPRTLLLILAGLALNTLIFAVGPYAGLTAEIGASSLLEQRVSAPVAHTQAALVALTPEQRVLYYRHLVWNLGLIVGNTLVLVALIGVAAHRFRVLRSSVLIPFLLALAPGALDLIENLLTAVLLAQRTGPAAVLVSATSLVVVLKFAALAAALLAAVVLWLAVAVRWRAAPAVALLPR